MMVVLEIYAASAVWALLINRLSYKALGVVAIFKKSFDPQGGCDERR